MAQRAMADQPAASADRLVPLAVDLDGTLLRTDLLWESLAALVKRNPLSLLLFPLWLVRGRAGLKRQAAARAPLDVSALPYHGEFLAFLREERERGRPLILTTGADAALAERIAGHLGIFSEVIASDGRHNVRGRRKAEILRSRFGEGGFDYAGNGRADLSVWPQARAAVLVNASAGLARQVRRVSMVARVFEDRRNRMRTLLRALRPLHWVKNLLVFVPVVTAHHLTDVGTLLDAGLAFAAFSLAASSVYVLNDLADLEHDRHHPTKGTRPFASGHLSIPTGLAMVLALWGAAGLTSAGLPLDFRLVLVGYLLANLVYSLSAKNVALVDVILLALLYGSRVLAGGVATSIAISPWLVAFSGFVFLSLALVKRVSELRGLRLNGGVAVPGRGYLAGDLEQLASLGSASGYVAVLVFALYINSDEVRLLYASPGMLWAATPLLLYWISRVWLLAHRGRIPEDPIVWVVKDPVSYLIGLAVAAILVLAA
ncbi:MAG: UbiA family prenyltransferase [bacterium]